MCDLQQVVARDPGVPRAALGVVEMPQRRSRAVALFGVAGVLAATAVAGLWVSAAVALALIWPVWLAALVMTAVLVAVARVVLLLGRDRIEQANLMWVGRALIQVIADVMVLTSPPRGAGRRRGRRGRDGPGDRAASGRR
jgi:putative superfamily III holin-X